MLEAWIHFRDSKKQNSHPSDASMASPFTKYFSADVDQDDDDDEDGDDDDDEEDQLHGRAQTTGRIVTNLETSDKLTASHPSLLSHSKHTIRCSGDACVLSR